LGSFGIGALGSFGTAGMGALETSRAALWRTRSRWLLRVFAIRGEAVFRDRFEAAIPVPV